jgi:hypothetical protein
MGKAVHRLFDHFSITFSRPLIWVPAALIMGLVVIFMNWWEWLEPLTGVFSLVAIVVAVAQTRKATLVIKKNTSAGPLTVINMSGHPLRAFESDWGIGAVMCDAAVQLDVSSTDALKASIFETLLGLPSDIRARLLAADPNVVLVPPNLPAGVLLMDAILHGIVGEFVRISWSRRVEGGGFVWMRPVDRQALRLEARHRLRVDGKFKGE